MALYLYIYTVGLLVSVSNPSMHAGRPPSHSAYLAPSARAEAERCVQTGPTAARHLLLSLTRQWLITERHLTQY